MRQITGVKTQQRHGIIVPGAANDQRLRMDHCLLQEAGYFGDTVLAVRIDLNSVTITLLRCVPESGEYGRPLAAVDIVP
jgi:hypothetical protein